MNKLKYILLTFIIPALSSALYSQSATADPAEMQKPIAPAIMMHGEVRQNSVSIRWAPTTPGAWRLLNQYGVQLERITLVRDGQILDAPETVILSNRLKPEESDEFIRVANQYPYAAIIAQAIFGESFVVSGAGSGDIETIIALSDELLQRFALSLYAADLCFPAALAVGWGWEDKTIKENERYLYRVISLVPQNEPEIENGALFVDPQRIDELPAPLDFAGQFMDGSVLLSWNVRIMESIYTAYIPERSTDGIRFTPITETPIVRMDDSESNDQIFFADSIQNNITYHYRLVGLTPFGSRSEYSDTISGMGLTELRNPPFITRAVPDETGGVLIEWEFDTENEKLIESFTLERSDNDRDYSDLITDINKTQRTISVSHIPFTANYFTITANSNTGKRLRSFSALVQPVDTVPPAVPAGLTAIADISGVVTLSWQANTDKGSFGYRIFRGQTAEEEMIPLNDIAHHGTVFVDSIDLHLLNRSLFYAITALDERYTQSDKSEVVEVKRPEIIPPTPPLISEIRIEDGSNTVVWISGGESTLAGYHLYRQNGNNIERGFELIEIIDGAHNTEYTDNNVENNVAYTYRIQSRSEGGLVSEPSRDYRVTAMNSSGETVSVTFTATARGNSIRLNWNAPVADAANIQLYKKIGDNSFGLLHEGLSAAGEIDDPEVSSGVKYEYMLVVRRNGVSPVKVVKNIVL
jgi:fibronectin type 3 domain-containing protein